MKNVEIYFLVIPIILLLTSCSEDPNDAGQNLIVQTNKTNYSNGEAINFTINNFNSSTAHLASCCTSVAFYIDKKENENWVEHSNFGLPCLALCPGIDLTIDHLETIADSITFSQNGTFRIRIPYSFNQAGNWNSEILSNSFIVE